MLARLKERVFEANMDLVRHQLVVMTWGNASGIDRDRGLVVIKPSGVGYDRLKPADMVVVDLTGKVVEGNLRPSSDTPTHLVLYRAWAKVGGIVHTHSAHATMWAQARHAIPCFGTTHADHVHGNVPVTRLLSVEEVAADYEGNTGEVIVERFADQDLDPVATPAILVAGHGPFTWGPSPAAAVKNAVALEEIAKMALGTLSINPQAQAVPRHIVDKHYYRKHGPAAYYGQPMQERPK